MRFPRPRAKISETHLSPLEVLHPEGFVRACRILGSGCPEALRPNDDRDSTGAPDAGESGADLVVVAPDRGEGRSPAWLRRAAGEAAEAVSGDGLVYVLAASPARYLVARHLRRCGFKVEAAMGHLPNAWSSFALVPFDPEAVRFVLGRIVTGRFSRVRLLAAAGNSAPVAQILAFLVPGVGLVLRRPGGRGLSEWLRRPREAGARTRAVTVMRRSGGDGATVLRFGENEPAPTAVAKVARGPQDRLAREARALERLRPGAESAGACLPQVIGVEELDGTTALVETLVGGGAVASLLASRPQLLLPVIERLVSWLHAWQQRTEISGTWDARTLEETIVTPCRRVAPLLDDGAAYLQSIEDLCREALGTPTRWVAVHNDLTMFNVMLDERGRLGVVDWEAAAEHGVPLSDFAYAVTDAVAATDRYRHRASAFEAAFTPGGRWAGVVGRLEQQLVSSLGLSPTSVRLSFHSCWLLHAANEIDAGHDGSGRPFLEIMSRVTKLRSRPSTTP